MAATSYEVNGVINGYLALDIKLPENSKVGDGYKFVSTMFDTKRKNEKQRVGSGKYN